MKKKLGGAFQAKQEMTALWHIGLVMSNWTKKEGVDPSDRGHLSSAGRASAYWSRAL